MEHDCCLIDMERYCCLDLLCFWLRNVTRNLLVLERTVGKFQVPGLDQHCLVAALAIAGRSIATSDTRVGQGRVGVYRMPAGIAVEYLGPTLPLGKGTFGYKPNSIMTQIPLKLGIYPNCSVYIMKIVDLNQHERA